MMENYHESDLSKKIPSQKEKVTYQKKKNYNASVSNIIDVSK